MHSAKEKISNMASSVKEKIIICKAKADEKAEKAVARTNEEKRIAHELRKAKEAEAKMELHQEKAEHAAENQRAKQTHIAHHLYGQPQPMVGAHHTMGPMATTAGANPAPEYPTLAGHPYVHKPI